MDSSLAAGHRMYSFRRTLIGNHNVLDYGCFVDCQLINFDAVTYRSNSICKESMRMFNCFTLLFIELSASCALRSAQLISQFDFYFESL